MDFLRDIWQYMKERKKFWLLPVILFIVVIGAIVVLAGNSVVAPFIYSLF